jgi:hypothetical protein
MRIWSLHPKYLDNKGLVALWREALLAKHVLNGLTIGYKNHPQLDRFKNSVNASDCIDHYLTIVYFEALERGYNFDKGKINWDFKPCKMTVTSGQLDYEKLHLLKKLEIRDKKKYFELAKISFCDSHPIFEVQNGGIEKWEVIK